MFRFLCSKYKFVEVWGLVDETEECCYMNFIIESDVVLEVI